MEYLIKTIKGNRREFASKICLLGMPTDQWPDGSFNFRVYNEECADELGEICEDNGIEAELV